MATRTLSSGYLIRLTVANHDGVTQQIDDRLKAIETDNELLIKARKAVSDARQAEDAAYRRYSSKDFTSDDLKKADVRVDNYMSAIRGILNALIYLPDDEPIRRKAQKAVQLFKDFNYSISGGIEAESRKAFNMVQQWKESKEYTLSELGIEEWVDKVNETANNVLALIAQRVQNESEKVKGEMADARKVTDGAIRKAYDIINALMILSPTDELTKAVNLLLSIEDRARLYYINTNKGTGSKPGGAAGADEDGGDDDGQYDDDGAGDTDGNGDGGDETGGTSGGQGGDSDGGGSSSGGSDEPGTGGGGNTGGSGGGIDKD